MAIHPFSPSRYYRTLGSHAPALRIADGDTIITTTVDAAGRDATGERVTPGGNPQTGPFFVEGAEPGDALAIHLEKLTPNRELGWSSSALAPNVVDPAYFQNLPAPGKTEWRIDLAAGTATLAAGNARLGKMAVPLAPMLGCFGVAPPDDQAISTATSGEHGGNMDYRGYVAGVTAYFPVFVTGALVHVGDGHAAQGDGEIVGTGVEISFDVQFSVRVKKGWTIGWPRGENESHIFTVGSARPLDQALQHATTEMMRWLQSDYGMDATEASTVLGQCVEYDLGNIFDPAYTMVCKVAKRHLS